MTREESGEVPPGAAATSGAARALALLRDPQVAAPLRARAWGEVVGWLYEAHYRPSLEARLARRLAAHGLGAAVAPGEVFTAFCLRLRERPELLGSRALPTRTWVRRALERECREHERRARTRERGRVHPRGSEPPGGLLERQELPGSRQGDPAGRFLGSPEAAALLKELGVELARELGRLEAEDPQQHAAFLLKDGGATYPQIGERLSASVGTVKSWVSRARAKLQARLAAYLEGRHEGR